MKRPRTLTVGILAAIALGGPAGAGAAPAADVVVVWAPQLDRAPLAAAARDLGVALVDRSPQPAPPASIAVPLRAGIDAYDALKFDDAWVALERARELAERTGGDGATPAELSDLFVYRALVQAQRAPDAAWDELVAAATVDPTRVLDRARFPPKLVDQLDRARAQIAAQPRAPLVLVVPAGCAIRLDGRPWLAGQPQVAGAHLLAVRCPDRQPWGTRVAIGDGAPAVTPALVALAAPTDAELAQLARDAGARGVASVVVTRTASGPLATVRVLGLDGRERGRRSVAAPDGDLEPAATALRASLATPTTNERPTAATPWYRQRWVWAVGGAVLAGAIAIPITAAIAHDGGLTSTGNLHATGALP